MEGYSGLFLARHYCGFRHAYGFYYGAAEAEPYNDSVSG